MTRDLQSFVRELDRTGDLVRVREPISAELEITALADRLVKAGGPALLFENVVGSDYPLAINLFATPQRLARALGVGSLDELGQRVHALLDMKVGSGLMGLASNLPKLRSLAALPPKRVRRAPAQQVVWRGDEVDLGRLPVLTCWPGDGGPFVTLPLVITRDPVRGDVNVGMYRMQVYGPRTTGMHWQRHKTGARHLENAAATGRPLPVAVALGGDPALIYAATAPLPPVPGLNEFSLAGWLRGRRTEVTKGVSVDLDVPAHAEMVLEGYVDPAEPWRPEGPFGDHTGFYTLVDDYPTFHVTAVTMRRDAIYPTTIVGRPPMEDAAFIEASERLFLPPAQLILPELIDYHMPPAGIAHNLVNVTIRKSYPGQAYKVANGLLGLGQMMFAKVILVTDHGTVAPQEHAAFWRHVLRHARPGRDQQLAKGPIDVLDHASRAWGYGSKLVLDGTIKHEEEGGEDRFEPAGPRHASVLPHHGEITGQHQPGGGFWFIATRKTRSDQGRHLGEWAARQTAARGVRWIAVLDETTDTGDFEACMWTMLNNIDPERDVQVIEDALSGPTWVVDGTPKLASEGFTRPWPDKIVMDREVQARIDERFADLIEAARREQGTGADDEDAAPAAKALPSGRGDGDD
ncbi:MAG: menaquinone biosynthesis decarboxylase [Trueperaceae bacterium]|nr:menaquinone biosynthesis decarboxylase [Trueperaceae bacterium]